MMNLEDFLENYSNVGMNPYIVLNDNDSLPTETSTKELQVLDIKSPAVEKFIKGYNLQKNPFKEYTGYLILLSKNSQSAVQTCFLTSQSGFKQNVKNVVIVEDNSELSIFTGCLSSTHVKSNIHNAVTDIFVGRNSIVTFNMIHSWGETSKVFPKLKVYVDEGGVFMSNYVVWEKVQEISSNPEIFVKKGGKAVIQSLVYSHPGSSLNVGGKVFLKGGGSRGEILSSVISKGGNYKTITEIIGNGDKAKGHIECNAVLLGDDGKVETVPLLKAGNSTVQLSHEASIGKISKEEIQYLQTKGLNKDRARELIVKGFVNDSIKEMPSSIQEKIEDIMSNSQGF